MDIFTPLRLINSYIKCIRNLILLIDNSKKDKTIFVDVTEIHIKDTKSGVQRVTNEVLRNLKLISTEYEVKEVYALPHEGGFYLCKNNKPLKISKQDIFFGLDLSKFILQQNKFHLKKMYKNNIPVYFFLHDLMPITIPQYCNQSVIKTFPNWLRTIIQYTGVISNSQSTMNELKDWLDKNPKIKRNENLKLSYVHLGCNFSTEKNLSFLINKNEKLNFLMVSTVEPRKNYRIAVEAFSKLWQKNLDINLVIVGKKGWNCEETFNLIENSTYFNKNLFWYNTGISDEELSELYKSSTAVLITSIAEGFGLPLIEAAHYKKPIICRDLPVFREIADNHAYYFSTNDAIELSQEIENWIDLYNHNKHPTPEVKIYTWEQCSKEVFDIITKER